MLFSLSRQRHGGQSDDIYGVSNGRQVFYEDENDLTSDIYKSVRALGAPFRLDKGEPRLPLKGGEGRPHLPQTPVKARLNFYTRWSHDWFKAKMSIT